MNLEETKSFFNILFSSLMDDAWNDNACMMAIIGLQWV
jgi:hypothetical protein